MKTTTLSNEEGLRLAAVLRDHIATLKIPNTWGDEGLQRPWCRAWRPRVDGVAFLEAEHHDGVDWWHLSISRRKQLPSWGELNRARDVLLPGLHAVQVLAIPDEHVNIHHFCLHVFARVDGVRALPDFRHQIEGI